MRALRACAGKTIAVACPVERRNAPDAAGLPIHVKDEVRVGRPRSGLVYEGLRRPAGAGDDRGGNDNACAHEQDEGGKTKGTGHGVAPEAAELPTELRHLVTEGCDEPHLAVAVSVSRPVVVTFAPFGAGRDGSPVRGGPDNQDARARAVAAGAREPPTGMQA